jgi:MarR family transcriptional regulator, organic hydroperoxide resistance regulator
MSNSSAPELLLQNQICFAVYSTAHAFAQAYKPHLDPMGLTYPQYLVMLLLWEQDGRSVNEIAHPLHLDSGTLTPLLKRMEKAGLVTRRRDTRDERILRTHLTAHGKSLREKARAIPPAMLCATGLELDGLVTLREEIKALGNVLRNP